MNRWVLCCAAALGCVSDESTPFGVRVEISEDIAALFSEDAPGGVLIGEDTPEAQIGTVCGEQHTLFQQGFSDLGACLGGDWKAWLVPLDPTDAVCGRGEAAPPEADNRDLHVLGVCTRREDDWYVLRFHFCEAPDEGQLTLAGSE